MRNFVFDRSALEICKLAKKTHDSDSMMAECVWITTQGVLFYSNSYFVISYKLPEPQENTKQGTLFAISGNPVVSKIDTDIVFYGKEMANILNLKSDIDDVGNHAIIRNNEKGGIDVFWDSGIARVKYYLVQPAIDRPAFEAMQRKDGQNGSRMLFDTGLLEKCTKIIHKIQKKKDDTQIMINMHKSDNRIELTAEGLSVVIMALKMK